MPRWLVFPLRLLFFCNFLAALNLCGIAQEKGATTERKNLDYKWLLGVGVESGMGFTSVQKLIKDLDNTVLFQNANRPPLCTSVYGLRVFLNSASRWAGQVGIYGASHSVIVGAANETAIAEARLKFLGAKLLLGYTLLSRPLLLNQSFWQGRKPFWQLYPFAGCNIGSQTLQILNCIAETEQIGQIEKISVFPATPLYLRSASLQAEVGLGATFYTDSKTGLYMSVELGGVLTPLASSWKNNEAGGNTTDLANRLTNGVFFRIALGGFLANLIPQN